ncbi:aminoacyl-tRNA hydrolase [Ligilactobacillus saerimneri]|uniref:Peptidyl-tRNA hydrolase n=1 Tax=Ligilactobacillus saerimneri 30a TaxID=1227363 RepID=M5J4A3_9LACO|nr:aminoacyl-tRNA hydrolase [Ligilactobacillus saerimneri]EKW98356.1 peptidyl-tRNA hydrolase [Ligilactobacillus saerimneri 30a]HJF29635.1 aminoacyl-tRNA hydrolase [Ligilactobacillus saerimneri]
MKMVVGLGNIGKKYEATRHNVGFMVVDELAQAYGATFAKEKMNALVTEIFIAGEKVLLVKPTTYMNESGRAVRPLMDFYKIPVEDIIICHDDMDLDIGKLRLRQKGSAGGHNGIKSIISHVGTQSFKRLRVGIGHPDKMTVVDWVLSRFSQAQKAVITDTIADGVAAIEEWVKTDNFAKVMNDHN